MLLSELRFAANYPFSKVAKEMFSGRNVNITYDVMEKAKKRIMSAIRIEDIPMLETNDSKLLEEEILSYPIARMIISLTYPKFLIKYINAEVRRAVRYLREDEYDQKKLAEEFGIVMYGMNMDIRSYLKYIPKIEGFSLINQNINNGYVILSQDKFLVVLGEAIRSVVSAGLPLNPAVIPKELKKDIEEAAQEINEEFKERFQKRITSFSSGEIAPCMKNLMERLKNGENIPHVARWALATYLLKRGSTVDEIVNIFSNAPNFNEKITRYQLEFIKKKGYSVPLCINLDSYGICVSRCGIKSPLQYSFRKKKKE